MRTYIAQPSHLFAVLLSSFVLSACGAGSSPTELQASAATPVPAPSAPPASDAPPMAAAAAPHEAPLAEAGPINPPVQLMPRIESGNSSAVPMATDPRSSPVPPPASSVSDGTSITSVTVENTGPAQVNVPVTFGHVFSPGHVSNSQSVAAKLADGTTLPLQVDVKARHPDGSVRHAILSARIGNLAAGQNLPITLSAVAAPGAYSAVAPTTLVADNFTAAVNVTIAGVRYSASAEELLRSGQYKTWLSGPVINEWLVSAPLKTAQGTAHPHLSARFAIRAVSGAKQARVDVTVENTWAYEAAPQNFTYDAQVLVGGLPVYTKADMTHYHHARWRKTFWWGAQPSVHIKHDVTYLISTRALPNYDRKAIVPEKTLANMKANWTGAKTEPMGNGMALPYMPATGGRPDIGILPGWAATYLLSMDKRAKEVTMGTADLAGSWSSHYRNKTTDRPVTLQEFPYMTILGRAGDVINPVTKKSEGFPACATATGCASPNQHDASHQPGFAYLPYLVSGDYYYLEELQFWTMWNSFFSNPGYRQNVKGLFAPDQVRGQAWSLRTLAQAAYITPDNDVLKAQFATLLDHNLDWYNTTYSNNPSANVLGVLVNSATVYSGGTGVAPWQDDFFTAAVGHTMELGFAKARPLLAYKTKFPVLRMSGSGACWILGATYSMNIRDTATSPFYTSIAKAVTATHSAPLNSLRCASQDMATFLKLKVGEMTGYASSESGYPSNMQPALAFAVDVGGVGSMTAWNTFTSRAVKPNYGLGPQFGIVPRMMNQ